MTEQQTNREERKKQTERLVHKLITAIDEYPDKANNYYDLGSLLTRLQDYAQAEELFMKALGIFEAKGDQEAQNLLNYGLETCIMRLVRLIKPLSSTTRLMIRN